MQKRKREGHQNGTQKKKPTQKKVVMEELSNKKDMTYIKQVKNDKSVLSVISLNINILNVLIKSRDWSSGF